MRIIAEGVETAEVLERLRETGCDLAQGHHLARPLPAAQLQEWLAPSERLGEHAVGAGRGGRTGHPGT